MKNPSPEQLRALRERAGRIAAAQPPPLHAADGRLTPRSRERLEEAVRRVARKNRVVGLSLVLCHPGGANEAITLGHARLSPKMPVNEKTCFRAASVSKLVMTFGALSLAESGHLSLDEDVGTYLGYPVHSPHAPDAPVTLRMLLTHTSGLCDEGNYGSRGMEAGCTLRELLAEPKNWLPAAPGAAFHYSNLGAGAAGCVMERAANMPFEEIMQSRVFLPLRIRASYDPRRIWPHEDLADGYAVRPLLPPLLRYDAAALSARPPQETEPGEDYLCAAGRMITDSAGMAGLIRLLASKDGLGVLSPESLERMRSPQDGIGGIGACGRGLNVAFLPEVFPGRSVLGHQGVAYGMCAELFADPQRGAGVGLMTSGARLIQSPPLMRAGFDLLALGFSALGY